MFSNNISEVHHKINDSLQNASIADVVSVLEKIEQEDNLNLLDYATLLLARNSEHREKILRLSEKITRNNFNSRVGFIVPIYIDTRCGNKCKYCGMASYVKNQERAYLDYDSFLEELKIVTDMGYNTVELVAGSLSYNLELLEKMMSATRNKVNGSAFCFDSLTTEEYKVFTDPKDTMVLFQETYNEEKYHYYHPADTKKGNYEFRLDAPERAISAGIKKFGMGILFGLFKIDYDILMLIEHGNHLKNNYGISPHLIGIPRLKIADGAEIQTTGFEVSDDDYIFATAIYRIAFPDAEIVASTRENPEFIGDLLKYSATFTNFCCSLRPGGYKELKDGYKKDGQFHYYSPGMDIINDIIKKNNLQIDFNRYI